MTSKELTEAIEAGTGGTDKGRIFNIRAGLSAAGKIPTYNDPVTPTAAAWYLLAYSLCPHSSTGKVAEWIKEKDREWSAMAPEHNPVIRLAFALSDLETRKRLISVMIDRTWGIWVLNLRHGEEVRYKEIPTQNIPANYKEVTPIRKVLMIGGDFIREISNAITEKKEVNV
jgi:hypothetical protein